MPSQSNSKSCSHASNEKEVFCLMAIPGALIRGSNLPVFSLKLTSPAAQLSFGSNLIFRLWRARAVTWGARATRQGRASA